MTMEKTGDIKPGKTPDTEDRLKTCMPPAGQKVAHAAAQTAQQVKALDDDVTSRLAKGAQK